MNQDPHIRAFWKARKETHRECVARALRFLEAISAEPGLNKWFKGGRTRKEASVTQELSMDAIGKRMTPVWRPCKGVPDSDLTDELGFSFGAWNGNDDAGASFLISCGSYDSNKKNSVSLDLPRQQFPGDEASRERFKRLLNIFAEVWDPDFALVTTSERKAQAFKDYATYSSTSVWEGCHFKSAWLLYRRGQPLVVDTTV